MIGGARRTIAYALHMACVTHALGMRHPSATVARVPRGPYPSPKARSRMSAKTVGFAISDEDRPELEMLVERFGHGNRSEFLRVAMRRLSRDLRAENLQELQSQARAQLGRVVPPEEVSALVKKVLRPSA